MGDLLPDPWIDLLVVAALNPLRPCLQCAQRSNRRCADITRIDAVVAGWIALAQCTHALFIPESKQEIPTVQQALRTLLLARLDGFAPLHQQLAPPVWRAVLEIVGELVGTGVGIPGTAGERQFVIERKAGKGSGLLQPLRGLTETYGMASLAGVADELADPDGLAQAVVFEPDHDLVHASFTNRQPPACPRWSR